MPPRAAIVVPTCNRPEVTRRCLQGILEQELTDFELVVIDDGSTDDTQAMLQQFAANHPNLRIDILRNERNIGANPSRNRGIAATTAPLVCFLDCDSIPEPQWLRAILTPFDDNKVGAVNGMVVDVPPRNVFELTLKGNHRVHGTTHANRLTAGNMCVRRSLLLRYGFDEDRAATNMTATGAPDVSVSGRGDEEGLFLHLRAAGHEIRLAHEAVIEHDHPIDGRSFLRQAWRGGRSAARLVYKYSLPHRLDVMPFVLMLLTLPALVLDWPWPSVPMLFLAAGCAALVYNDLCRKKKTLGETILSFPLLLLYYALRVSAYVLESLRLRLTPHGIKRVTLPLPTRKL